MLLSAYGVIWKKIMVRLGFPDPLDVEYGKQFISLFSKRAKMYEESKKRAPKTKSTKWSKPQAPRQAKESVYDRFFD